MGSCSPPAAQATKGRSPGGRQTEVTSTGDEDPWGSPTESPAKGQSWMGSAEQEPEGGPGTELPSQQGLALNARREMSYERPVGAQKQNLPRKGNLAEGPLPPGQCLVE